MTDVAAEAEREDNALDVLVAFLKLGVSSFGGPVAHLGYFRHEFVSRRRWLGEEAYADIVGLCQFLPGPASSQVAMTLGMLRGGYLGGLAAWVGFTLPSAVLMILFGYGVLLSGALYDAGWLHGLKIVAVAVVAQAVWGMGRALCPDLPRISLALTAAIFLLLLPSTLSQLGVMAVGGLIGIWALAPDTPLAPAPLPLGSSRILAVLSLTIFFGLLLGLPFFVTPYSDPSLVQFANFYRSGALVFGGGHVVLPLLHEAVVPQGYVSEDAFLAGYGAAQALPGPLFTFAAYLGTVMQYWPNGFAGAALCLGAIYLPSFLLLLGVLPFWEGLRQRLRVQGALRGINAAVVGMLLAAFFEPVWSSAIYTTEDVALALAALLLLAVWRMPAWFVVLVGAGVGEGMQILMHP